MILVVMVDKCITVYLLSTIYYLLSTIYYEKYVVFKLMCILHTEAKKRYHVPITVLYLLPYVRLRLYTDGTDDNTLPYPVCAPVSLTLRPVTQGDRRYSV